jgi:hypothetical protein
VPAAFFDAQGCLTPEGFARIAAAPPGGAPAELAAHLAACPRCQRRLLAMGAPPKATPGRRREPPPLWRTVVAVVGAILLVLMALTMMRLVTGGPR